MKKLLALFLTGILLVGCGGDGSQEVSESGEIENIIIGLDDSFAPMGFREDGELVGFDVDLAKAVFDEAGVSYEFQPIDWDTKELELNSGKIDCIWNGLTITDERKENMLFTEPYLLNNQIIFTLKDSDIYTKDDLSGKIVGAQAGSSSIDAIKRDTDTYNSIKEVNEYDTNVNAFLDLDIGRIDAVVCDEVVGRYYAENSNLANEVRVLDDNFGGEEYGIATRLDDTALNTLISDNLKKVNENGTGAAISEKWFGEDILLK